jgi:hypothetical protein
MLRPRVLMTCAGCQRDRGDCEAAGGAVTPKQKAEAINVVLSLASAPLTRKPNATKKETSIRKGKYGDYIFHKNSKMKKPKFLKIEGLSTAEGVKGDYKNCDIEFIHSWLSKTYDIKNK